MMIRSCLSFCLMALAPVSFLKAETPVSREPVAVAYVSSIDGALSDLEYIVTAGGRPEVAQMIQGFVTNLNNLDGIDRKQPIGLYAFVPLNIGQGKKDPDIVGFIPVTSVDSLQKTAHLSNVLSLESTDSADRYEFKTPEKTLSVKVQQGHAFISEKSDLLDNHLPMPQPLTSGLSGQYDIVVQVRREGVPKFLWDLVMFGAVGELDKHIQSLKGNTSPEKQAELKGVQMVRASTIATLTEVKSVWMGLNVSQENKTAQLDFKLQFANAGKVANSLQGLVSGTSPLTGAAAADAAGMVHLRFQMPEGINQLVADGIKVAEEKHDPLANVPESHRQTVADILEVATQTLQQGQGDLLLQFAGEPQTGMTLVAGVHIAEGAKLSASVEKLLPEVGHTDKVSKLTIDAGTARGVKFARIEGHDSGEKEKLFYGGQPSLFVGIQADTLWLLIGDDDALKDFESLEPAAGGSRAGTGNLVEAKLHLSDWLGLIGQARDSKTQRFTEAARAAISDPDHDAISFSVHPESDGLRASLTVDEAYLRLIGQLAGKDQ